MKTLSILNCGLTRPSKFNSLPLVRSVISASVIYILFLLFTFLASMVRAELFETGLALNQVRYNGNLRVSISLNL